MPMIVIGEESFIVGQSFVIFLSIFEVDAKCCPIPLYHRPTAASKQTPKGMGEGGTGPILF
jgi:hypothetical protein